MGQLEPLRSAGASNTRRLDLFWTRSYGNNQKLTTLAFSRVVPGDKRTAHPKLNATPVVLYLPLEIPETLIRWLMADIENAEN